MYKQQYEQAKKKYKRRDLSEQQAQALYAAACCAAALMEAALMGAALYAAELERLQVEKLENHIGLYEQCMIGALEIA